MDFGRLPAIDDVDFALPADPAANTRVLSARGRDGAGPALRVGLPAWSHKGFIGKVYPRGAKSGELLRHYARQFSAIELNSTYFAINEPQIEKWAAMVPEGFHFCPKWSSDVSHRARLDGDSPAATAFERAVRRFGPTLGATWLLLPQHFGPDRLGELAAFCETWAGRLPLAVELRHEAWFRARGPQEAVFELFERTGTIAVITDVAGRRDVLHGRLTTPRLFLRFVGNRLHSSDFSRLDAWVERIARWVELGLESAWIFLHQPEEPLGVELAEHVVPRLATACGVEISTPRRVETFRQTELF